MDIQQLSESISSMPEDELLVIYDILKEKLESDHANRMAKMPDLINPEFAVFDNRKVDKISEKVLHIRQRRYVAFVYYYSHPDRTDDQMIQFIQMANPQLSYIEALRDLSNIKLVIGNMPRARKDLIRWQVIEMHKKAYQKALENNNDLGMTTAANNIAKAAGLDKEDPEIPWDEINPPNFEPTADITVIDPDRKPKSPKEIDEQIAKLKSRYLQIEDVEPEL
jgi:hypothetical protein